MNLVNSFFLTLSIRFIVLLLGIVSGVIVARTLGPEGRGTFTAITVIVGLLVQFGTFGIQDFNSIQSVKDKKSIPFLIGNSLLFGFITSSILIAVSIFFTIRYPSFFLHNIDTELFIIALAALPFLLISSHLQNILIGTKKIIGYNIVQLVYQGVFLCGTVFLLVGYFALPGLIWWYLFASIIALFAVIFFLRTRFSFWGNFLLFKKGISFGLKSYIVSICAFLIIRMNIFLINFFLGSEQTGFYSAALSIAEFIYIFPSIFGILIVPRLIEYAAHSEKYTILLGKIIAYCMSAIIGVIFLFSHEIITLLYGEKFQASHPVLIILLWAVFFYSISNVFFCFFTSRGLPRFVFFLWIPPVALSILLAVILIPTRGIVGAAWSSFFIYFLIFLSHVIAFKLYTKTRVRDFFILSKEEIGIVKQIIVKYFFSFKRHDVCP